MKQGLVRIEGDDAEPHICPYTQQHRLQPRVLPEEASTEMVVVMGTGNTGAKEQGHVHCLQVPGLSAHSSCILGPPGDVCPPPTAVQVPGLPPEVPICLLLPDRCLGVLLNYKALVPLPNYPQASA